MQQTHKGSTARQSPTCILSQAHRHQALKRRQAGNAGGQHAQQLVPQRCAAWVAIRCTNLTLAGIRLAHRQLACTCRLAGNHSENLSRQLWEE